MREQLKLEKQAHARRIAVNPEGLARRAALCTRLGLSPDTSARQVLQVLISIAECPGAGRPRFVEDHFQPQDYIDAMEEYVTDTTVSDADREEAEKLLADLKDTLQTANESLD